MANEYRFSRKAESDLAQQLAENPLIGLPNIQDGVELFAFPYESHTLFYLEKEYGISIVRVLHQSMLPENYLGNNM